MKQIRPPCWGHRIIDARWIYHQKPNKLDTTVQHNRGSHWRNNSVKNRSWIRQHTNLPLHSLHYCLSIEKKRENLTPTFTFSTPSSSQTNLLTKSPLQQLIYTLGTHLQMPRWNGPLLPVFYNWEVGDEKGNESEKKIMKYGCDIANYTLHKLWALPEWEGSINGKSSGNVIARKTFSRHILCKGHPSLLLPSC
jgi:hypothetical protein